MTLKWGIAATGGIASKMVAALQTLDDAEIVAVGSRSPESAATFANKFAIPQAHGSYAELFADPNVDIVYIASPHSHHRHMAVAALDAGKHVLCEKAFAVNTTEATAMVDAARRNHRFLMEAMWTWFIPGNVELKRRIAEGVVGKVLTVDADFCLDIPATDGRHRRADLAGGALLDLGIYPVTFACHVLDKYPDDVKAMARLTESGVDATLAGVASFPGGALSTFQTSLDGKSGLSARIVGTDGRIEVEAPFWYASAFTVYHADGTAERVEIPNEGLAHEASHVMERIAAGHLESNVVTLDHSLQTMRLLDEIRAQVGVIYPSET
jgi:predicted dehydrogenase|tara:strand:- start:813 stop:1787 length:975 start_codon:yes stop_codon:yes gene_type:complete